MASQWLDPDTSGLWPKPTDFNFFFMEDYYVQRIDIFLASVVLVLALVTGKAGSIEDGFYEAAMNLTFDKLQNRQRPLRVLMHKCFCKKMTIF